jgi:hypothetical protein
MAGDAEAIDAFSRFLKRWKAGKSAKLTLDSNKGLLRIAEESLQEKFDAKSAEQRRKVAPSGGEAGHRRRGRAGPSRQRRKERRAAERTAAEEAAAAEKAAADAAAAENAAAAEKDAAEKAAAAERAAGAGAAEEAAGPKCTKCHRPVKGHPRPTGERCAADALLPSPERARGVEPPILVKYVTPVKGDLRTEDCSCGGGSLTPTHQCDQASSWADLELTELQALCKERNLGSTGDETQLRERLEWYTPRS